jgi:hypothetical protein
VRAVADPIVYPGRPGLSHDHTFVGHYSAHADFFNAWKAGALTSLVRGCLNALRHCGRGT